MYNRRRLADKAGCQRQSDVTPLGSERNAPRHFAGRREELDVLRRRVEYLLRHPGDTVGGMVLIDGVQGIGKTQLALEFARKACGQPGVRHLSITTRDLLVGADQLLADLTGQLPARKGSAAHWLDEVRRHFKQLPLRIQPRDGASSVRTMLARTQARGWWRKQVLILSIDEIQSITAEARSVLKILHEGSHDCPILVVGMGLQHASSVLASTMVNADGTANADAISRFGTRLSLRMLSMDESVEAIRLGVEATGLGHVPVDFARRVATESRGFPQHIHGYVEGCVLALDGHGTLATELAQNSALAQGRESRTRYYESRLASMRREHRRAVLALAARADASETPVADDVAERIMGDAIAGGEDTGAQALQEAVEKGVLSVLLNGHVVFPIPSFRDYALNLARGNV